MTLKPGLRVVVDGRGAGVIVSFTYQTLDMKLFGWVNVKLDAGGTVTVSALKVRAEQAAAA